MDYTEKLTDPRWQKKRLEILSRDDWTCTKCGDKDETLHVHHVEYYGDPWEVDSSLLVTLCKTCHTIIESYKEFTFIKILKISKRGHAALMANDVAILVIDDGVIESGLVISYENLKLILKSSENFKSNV